MKKIEIVGTLTGCYKHLPGEGKNRKFQKLILYKFTSYHFKKNTHQWAIDLGLSFAMTLRTWLISYLASVPRHQRILLIQDLAS